MVIMEKAIEHFKWKFENVWKPTPDDIKAYKAIIQYKEIQDSHNLSQNESLAKLWIFTLMSLNRTEMYSAERAIQVIDEILQKSVYEWCQDLHKNIKMLNFNSVLGEDYIKVIKDNNITNMYDLNDILPNEVILSDKHKELLKALKTDIKEDNIIKFVEKNISRIIQNEKQ